MNGLFCTNLVSFDTSIKVVFCIFVNCSHRAVKVNAEKSSVTIIYSNFQNCTEFTSTSQGGAIYTDSNSLILFKNRFDYVGCAYEGNSFYSTAVNGYLKEISISHIEGAENSHYIFRCFLTTFKNLNASNIKLDFDTSCSALKNAQYSFVNLIDCKGRTLFREKQYFQYCNAIDSTLKALFFDTMEMKSCFFSNIEAERLCFESPESPILLINCVFVDFNVPLQGNEEFFKIENSKTTGTSYLCLDHIPLIFLTCNRNPFVNTIHILLPIFLFCL